jgi:predicted amidohydrolase
LKQSNYLLQKKKMKRLGLLALIIFFTGISYWIWSGAGKVGPLPLRAILDSANITVENFGKADSADGNIIGMQPYLVAADYANEAGLLQVLQTYMEVAKKRGLLNQKTIVVFPEYIGSWLVAVNEKKKIYDSGTSINDALTLEVCSNIFKFIPAYFSSHSADKTKEALFKMKQPEMAAIYQRVFSRLASNYTVTIVAGSVVLEQPSINENGILTTGTGKLFNTSVVFNTVGRPVAPLIKKIFPILDEKGFTCAADSMQIPLFNTAAGKLAVLVCADSWFPAAYQQLNKKADVIAIPSLGGPDSIWNSLWNGYNGFAAPADVDTLKDYHRLTEGGAWIKYAMATRAPAAGIHNGMNVFFTGSIWDMHPEGRVLTLQNDTLHVSKPALQRGRISNLWFRH